VPDVGDDGSYAAYLAWAAKQRGLADGDFLGAAGTTMQRWPTLASWIFSSTPRIGLWPSCGGGIIRA
jgi:hypothetical protein